MCGLYIPDGFAGKDGGTLGNSAPGKAEFKPRQRLGRVPITACACSLAQLLPCAWGLKITSHESPLTNHGISNRYTVRIKSAVTHSKQTRVVPSNRYTGEGVGSVLNGAGSETKANTGGGSASTPQGLKPLVRAALCHGSG